MSTSNQNFIWRQIFIKQITARCEKERERERERERDKAPGWETKSTALCCIIDTKVLSSPGNWSVLLMLLLVIQRCTRVCLAWEILRKILWCWCPGFLFIIMSRLHPFLPAGCTIITHQIDVSIRQGNIGRLMSDFSQRSGPDLDCSRYHCHVSLPIVPSFVSYFTLQCRRDNHFIKILSNLVKKRPVTITSALNMFPDQDSSSRDATDKVQIYMY